MANKMLIDASHPEETRVVVVRGNKVQEFDFEAADKKPLRGNIYLAKVTRVEPSLQAAFVDYGGNRHGFLAFAEIHPDYYQIPVADRLALIEEESRAHQAEEDDHRPQPHHGRRRSRRNHGESAEKRAVAEDAVLSEPQEQAGAPSEHETPTDAVAPAGQWERDETAAEAPAFEPSPTSDDAPSIDEVSRPEAQADLAEENAAEYGAASSDAGDDDAALDQQDLLDQGVTELRSQPSHETIAVDPSGYGVVEEGAPEDELVAQVEPDHEGKARRQDERDEAEPVHEARRQSDEGQEDDDHEDHDEEDHVEHIGGDAMDETPYRAPRSRRQYKIQEVIKRRQVLLVQVVKEERGNKGAALTTYLSLAGRYSVLMPNTARGGGISRKITDGADRKRLKEIVHELEVPEGMGVILRTAGATRTKQEVKRDFEYLLRLWESVRELTLRSSAPTLVYEEGSLIKRAIRDLYGREVEEVVVAGEDAHREAKDFMRMLMPSHAKNVRLHRENVPIFADSGVEAQLDAMFSNQVTLKSGGYLVINQTEALVAIDVNSGRSTREHNIEDTALRTNLEAADEVARQLRLRDLAGLIVVDFIDMEEGRNNRSVERRLKDALKNDRARIQVGRISHFGLLEMSRQRIRAGVVEGSTVPCPHCAGAGAVRSTASIALHVLRVLEEALIKSASHDVTLRTRTQVALYILNQKRGHLQALEARFGVHITVAADDSLTGANYHTLERGEPATGLRLPLPQHLRVDSLRAEPLEEEDAPVEEDVEEPSRAEPQPRGRGRFDERRRSRRRPEISHESDEILEQEDGAEPQIAGEARGLETVQEAGFESGDEEGDNAQRSRRRRRRRGGRGGGANLGEGVAPGAEQPSDEGLAMVAEIEGSPAEPKEGRRDRSSGFGRRGAGRWVRSRPLAQEFHDPNAMPVASEAEDFAEAPPAEEAEMRRMSSLPEVDHVGVELAPEASPEPVVEPQTPTVVELTEVAPPPQLDHKAEAEGQTREAPAMTVVATPEAMQTQAEQEPSRAAEKVITQADPAAPKKGGWWQRAKMNLGNR